MFCLNVVANTQCFECGCKHSVFFRRHPNPGQPLLPSRRRWWCTWICLVTAKCTEEEEGPHTSCVLAHTHTHTFPTAKFRKPTIRHSHFSPEQASCEEGEERVEDLFSVTLHVTNNSSECVCVLLSFLLHVILQHRSRSANRRLTAGLDS